MPESGKRISSLKFPIPGGETRLSNCEHTITVRPLPAFTLEDVMNKRLLERTPAFVLPEFSTVSRVPVTISDSLLTLREQIHGLSSPYKSEISKENQAMCQVRQDRSRSRPM